MRIFQSLLLIVSLAVCYLLFFKSQSMQHEAAQSGAKTSTVGTVGKQPEAEFTPIPQSQYKAQLDRAHTVANQMKASHKDLESF